MIRIATIVTALLPSLALAGRAAAAISCAGL
jgi:hypothetical protein